MESILIGNAVLLLVGSSIGLAWAHYKVRSKGLFSGSEDESFLIQSQGKTYTWALQEGRTIVRGRVSERS